MKRTFVYFALAAYSFCLQGCMHSVESTSYRAQDIVQQSTTTSTSRSYNNTIESISTYSLSKDINGEKIAFTGRFSASAQPNLNVCFGLHFKKQGKQIDDSLATEQFSKLLDMGSAKRIKIDSVDYKVEGDAVKMKFLVFLYHKEDSKGSAVDKYTLVYLSNFKTPKPELVLNRVEKRSEEVFKNTY